MSAVERTLVDERERIEDSNRSSNDPQSVFVENTVVIISRVFEHITSNDLKVTSLGLAVHRVQRHSFHRNLGIFVEVVFILEDVIIV